MMEAVQITYRYSGNAAPAVTAVSVCVAPGETVGIVGPNGSGKSTIGRLLKGLLLPTEGTVVVDGVDAAEEELAVRRLVGLVFQNPNSQIVNAVVEQEVAFGPENLGLSPQEIRRRVDEALRAMDLVSLRMAECHELSMADKQRIAIASVMAMEPRYLILDEPTAWIEPAARTRVLGELQQWASQRQVGLVLITHRMDEAQLCGRLYGMLHGRLEIVGPPSAVLHDPLMRARLALGEPEAYVLVNHLHAAGLPVTAGESLDQVAESLWRS
ncbi:MAG: ATP-binding cassette domain-containing protein [Chloroflexota bacterium]